MGKNPAAFLRCRVFLFAMMAHPALAVGHFGVMAAAISRRIAVGRKVTATIIGSLAGWAGGSMTSMA